MSMLRAMTRRSWLRQASVAGLLAAGPRLVENAMADEPKRFRIVDPHVHVWKNDPRYPVAGRSEISAATRTPRPEMLLGRMQEHGVDQTVIVHVIYYRWDCRYAADAVRAHPDKFAGVCRVDPESTEADLAARPLGGARVCAACG